MKIDIDTDMTDGMQRTLDQVLARSRDMLPYFKVKAQELDTLIQADVFMASESPFDKPWKELSDTTVKMRRKSSKKPLIDSGNLRQSTFVEAKQGWIEFGVSGSAGVYAGTHQFGKGQVNSANFYKRKSYKRKAHTRTVNGKKQKVKAHTVKTTIVRGMPFGGAPIPARPFLPVKGTSSKNASPDFSKGDAKEWYDGMIKGLAVFMAEGKKGG